MVHLVRTQGSAQDGHSERRGAAAASREGFKQLEEQWPRDLGDLLLSFLAEA